MRKGIGPTNPHTGIVASDWIGFSPDGRRAAWDGCVPMPGDPCVYNST